jgi:tetratricopeptide (TPR) repeat protein
MNVNPKQFRAGRGIERPTWLPEPRPPHLVLDEVGGAAGYVLWLLLSDCGLWIAADQRAELFAPGGRDWAEAEWPAELVDAFSILRAASAAPELARAPDLAAAAASVWEWADAEQHQETALQLAELAARLDPDDPSRATTAGRFARRLGLHSRASRWFARGTRLARLHGDEIEFVTAHLAWGVLEDQVGNYLHAEAHFTKGFRRAMRAGRRSLAAAAKHNLMGVAVTTQRFEDAWGHAWDAARMYAAHHPRLPLFAHDVAFLFACEGYFSSALPILERVLPMVERLRERVLVLAAITRAAGAVRDRLRFERTAAEVLSIAARESELAAGCIYYVAEGARCFEQWERSRQLALQCLELADAREDHAVQSLATALLDALSRREPGAVDEIPPLGGQVDEMGALLLKRLRKHTAPRDRRAVPPEKFPVY